MAETRKKRILYIEDEAIIADLYAQILRHNGFDVTCAYDGESGLEIAQTQAFDFILLDIMLPGKSGIDVLTTLRDNAISSHFDQSTPIIMLTNFDEDDITKKRIMTMAQDYLIKVNISPHTLVNVLNDYDKKSTESGAKL